ncbi:MAG: sugar phosphate nucleotidyltransferase [Patescibacteria group bacterium]
MKKLPIVLILAGGVGKRFSPMMQSKDLFSFFGTPLLEWNLHHLELAGFTQVVIVCTKEDKERMSHFVFSKLQISMVVQGAPKGMADAVSCAASMIGNNPVIIMNAEDVVEPHFYSQLLIEAGIDHAWVVGKQVNSYFDGGYLKIEGDRVIEIVEKPGIGHEPSDRINLVFHYFPDLSVFTSLFPSVKTQHDDVYEIALSIYMKNHDVSLVSYQGEWSPLKYPWHVLDVNAMLLSQLSRKNGKNVTLKTNVVIEGNVHIEDNVTIYENTKIIGPCFIGEGTIIGNNNIIRGSHIGRRCVTGFNTDITRSYIGDDCWFHSNYIGDSVLESDISMGSGTVLANLRLDEEDIASVVQKEKISTQRNKCGALIASHVRIGVNVSIMPGVKIGSHTSIGAGLTIGEDIESESFCVGKNPLYTVKKNIRKVDVSGREKFRMKI